MSGAMPTLAWACYLIKIGWHAFAKRRHAIPVLCLLNINFANPVPEKNEIDVKCLLATTYDFPRIDRIEK